MRANQDRADEHEGNSSCLPHETPVATRQAGSGTLARVGCADVRVADTFRPDILLAFQIRKCSAGLLVSSTFTQARELICTDPPLRPTRKEGIATGEPVTRLVLHGDSKLFPEKQREPPCRPLSYVGEL